MKKFTLAIAIAVIASAAQADEKPVEASTTLPEITVYPSPSALLIDRLCRQIIADIGPQVHLIPLPQQQARTDQPEAVPTAPPESAYAAIEHPSSGT